RRPRSSPVRAGRPSRPSANFSQTSAGTRSGSSTSAESKRPAPRRPRSSSYRTSSGPADSPPSRSRSPANPRCRPRLPPSSSFLAAATPAIGRENIIMTTVAVPENGRAEGNLAAADHQLAHDLEGTGPVLVAVHGLTENRSFWSPVNLQQHFRVLSVDLRGHGDSPRVRPYGIDESVEDIHQLIES